MEMPSLRPTVALLSGSGFPTWYWDDVRDALGLKSYVVDYLKGDASIAQHARAILDGSGQERMVLVAHSIGGVVASAVCSTEPSRVAGVLGVCAAFPAPGTSYLDTLPRAQRIATRFVLRVAGTRVPRKLRYDGYAAQVDEDLAHRLADDTEPESTRLFTGRIGTPRWPAHTGYVITCADQDMPVQMQERAANQLGASYRRELETGHLPMLTRPTDLAAAIKDFVDQVD